ncbi:MAG: peptidoglycan bridge formation glycyltransferase FemA/FemB family protein [Deltaproteobacteria bacterium]
MNRWSCITDSIAVLEDIFEHIINKGWGFVALAFLKSTCLAGAIFFYFGKMANYKFGASSRKHQHLRPNNLVMWEAIRECIKRGSRKFSFGRTATDNKGLLQFKRSWNPQEGKVHYYKYDLRKNSFLTKSIRVKGFYNEIFNVTPIPVLRLVGAAVYKHLG